MRIEVNGCRLFVDVVGEQLRPEGPIMRERPVVFLLHGGPGFDHSSMKPDFNPLADVAQLIYYDHRGQGRSDPSEPSRWHLNQWADDLYELIGTLGVTEPIVLGLSFGGFVAQNYAIRHPDRLHKLILASTVARMRRGPVYDAFERLGGVDARRMAEAFWSRPNAETMAEYMQNCMPLYTRTPRDPDASKRSVVRPEVIEHFAGPDGENWRFDYREALAGLDVPTLVTGGELDPVTPIAAIREMAACIPGCQLEVFADAGHGVHRDTAAVFALMQDFITA